MKQSTLYAAVTHRYATYKRVWVFPDASILVGSPSTHRVIRVKSLATNGSRQEICARCQFRSSILDKGILTSPTLTHSPAFAPSKTPRVCGTTSQADAETMGQLVNNDTALEIPIAVRVRGVPEVHSAPTVLPVWGGHEVGIVVSGSVLSICNHCIPFLATTTEVMLLEVAGNFVKAITGNHKHLQSHRRTCGQDKTYR